MSCVASCSLCLLLLTAVMVIAQAKKLVLLKQLAALEQQQAGGAGDADGLTRDQQALTLSEVDEQLYGPNMQPMSTVTRGRIVPQALSSAHAQLTLDKYHAAADPVHQYLSMPLRELREPQAYSMPATSHPAQQQLHPSLKVDTVPQQYTIALHANSAPVPYGMLPEADVPQQFSMQHKHEVTTPQPQAQEIHASAGLMVHANASQSTRFVVPPNKVTYLANVYA